MNADGTSQTRLTNDAAVDEAPSWSPDGTRIAFHSFPHNNSTDSEIYVMNADGTGQTQLTINWSYDLEPAWQPVPEPPAFAFLLAGSGGLAWIGRRRSGVSRIRRPAFGAGSLADSLIFQSSS